MTHVPRHWPLGISAALRGFPLVVVGVGRTYGGHGTRIPAVLRASQVLDVLAPGSAVVSTDGADTIVANGAT
eukprot:1736828-Prymnesium_polylepis.1